MRGSALVLLALAFGGCKKDHTFPIWSDGILLEGDCQEEYEVVDGVTVLTSAELPDPDVPEDPIGTDPLWHMDDLPDPLGTIVTNDADYEDLWFTRMNFAYAPAVDFSQSQAVFVWMRNTDSCAVTIDEWHANTKGDLGIVLDVTFYDDALNCPSSCGNDSKALVMAALDRELDVSLCRRIRPGCEPEQSARSR